MGETFIKDYAHKGINDGNGSRVRVASRRDEPWGEIRYSEVAENLSTTPAYKLPVHTFTGQRSYMDDPSTSGMEGFGLMDYNARMYDPQVGRFTSADTIVPGGVQGLDRYAYVNNSPIVYTDPSGHSQRHSDYWWSQHGGMWKQAPCTNDMKQRYCYLPNGAVIDKSHYDEGADAWTKIEAQWRAWKRGETTDTTVDITMSFGKGKNPFTFTEAFDFSGITSESELREKATEWFIGFQQRYEQAQYDHPQTTGARMSAFNSEDIPSTVIGFVAKSNHISFEKSINILTGGKGGIASNSGRYHPLSVKYDCLSTPSACGQLNYQNGTPSLKVVVDVQPIWLPGGGVLYRPIYGYILYPKDSIFDILNP